MPDFIWDILESVVSKLLEDCLSNASQDEVAKRIARNDRRDRIRAYRQTRDEVIASKEGKAGRQIWREHKAAIRRTIFKDFDAQEAGDVVAACAPD